MTYDDRTFEPPINHQLNDRKRQKLLSLVKKAAMKKEGLG